MTRAVGPGHPAWPAIARGARPAIARIGIALAVTATLHPAAASPAPPLPDTHRHAPPFRIESLEHDRLDLARLLLRGPVLLDFWATWCKPCVAALPELESLQRRYRARGLTVVGISIDGPRNFARVRPFIARLGLTFPVALDEDGSLQQAYQVRAAPTSFLIDRGGEIVQTRVGYERGAVESLERAIKALLPAAADSSAPDSATRARPDR